LNEDVRDIVIDVLQGTPSAEPVAPELTRTTSYYEVGLADILVEVDATQISQDVITDTRLLNSRCGMISAIGEIDTETLFVQLTTDFNNWFDGIKGQLGEDIAGNLQYQINEHTTKEVASEEGVHGIRYYNDTIEVEQDGEYKDSLSHLVKIENSKLEGNVKITPNNSNELSVVCGEGLTHPTIYINSIKNTKLSDYCSWSGGALASQSRQCIGGSTVPSGRTWVVWTSKTNYDKDPDSFKALIGKTLYFKFTYNSKDYFACGVVESVGSKYSSGSWSDGSYIQLINDDVFNSLSNAWIDATNIKGIYTDLETKTFNNYNVFGNNLSAQDHQMLIGHYNDAILSTDGVSSGTSTGTAFCIGNGTESAGSNALRITYDGKVYAKNSTVSTGADYSEYFEWADGNENKEDRVGYFVTFDDKQKIRKANATDDYILGIVSGLPCIIGNGDECWRGRYIYDEFGRFIEETFEYEEIIDGKSVTKIGTKYKENPEYDSSKEYIERAKRKEWSAVGMVGVLSVYDDGTCQENGYCTVSDGGIATACKYSNVKAYRVLERVTDNIIKVLFK
jgi:hypothetical protein